MPYLRVNYRSDWVGRKDISIFYPIKAPDAAETGTYSPVLAEGAKLRVLYLIHGSGGDFSDWPLNTMVMKMCEEFGIIAVMPTVQDFMGSRIELGDFYACVSRELPEFICNILPASPAREHNYIAGFSLGGYFAYRIALNNPDRYAAAGSFGAPVDTASWLAENRHNPRYPQPEEITGSDRDIMHTARKLKSAGTQAPKLFQACGIGDPAIQNNKAACREFLELGFDHKWLELPGKDDYDFYHLAFIKFLNWLQPGKGPVFPDSGIVLPRGGRFYED